MDFLEWFNKEVLDEVKIAFKPLAKRKKAIIFLICLFFVAVILGRYNKALVIIPLLVILGSLSMIYKDLHPPNSTVFPDILFPICSQFCSQFGIGFQKGFRNSNWENSRTKF